jgi:tripartite-type tricarboxylate transporter receptor subunit TctC
VKGYEGANWWGILLPAGTSPAIVDRLDKEFAAILALDEVKQQFVKMGAETDYLSKAALTSYIEAETQKWSKVARQAGIQAQ